MFKYQVDKKVCNFLSIFLQLFSTLFNTYVYRRVSFTAVDIIISKEEKNIQSKNFDDGNDNIFFCLKVWHFGGWAETSLNQFEQKLSKITLHGN